eukprot:289031-Prorocentrum_minimum.AAC.1
MQEARVYSHDGPIRCRKHGYILTADQSDAGSTSGPRAGSPPPQRRTSVDSNNVDGKRDRVDARSAKRKLETECR